MRFTREPRERSARTAIAAVLLSALCFGGCAADAQRPGNDPRDGTRPTQPGIDYRGFPYSIQAG